jgi:hypothetical protein
MEILKFKLIILPQILRIVCTYLKVRLVDTSICDILNRDIGSLLKCLLMLLFILILVLQCIIIIFLETGIPAHLILVIKLLVGILGDIV